MDAMGAALAIEERTTATALVEYTALRHRTRALLGADHRRRPQRSPSSTWGGVQHSAKTAAGRRTLEVPAELRPLLA